MFTTSAVSVDRLLALLLRLRYRQVVTLKRTNIWSCDRVLGFLNLHGSHFFLELRCMGCFGDFYNFIVPCDIHFLLLEDLPHPASSSKSISRQRPGTNESNISTQDNETIQKDIVQWNVRTVGISFVLFAFFVGVAIRI